LIYMHEGTLFARSFDRERLDVRGLPVPILDDVTNSSVTGSAQLDFSGRTSGLGALVYFSGKGAQTSIFWLDSAGKTQPLHAAPGFYLTPRFSPDGKRLVVALFSGSSGLWLSDVERDAMLRLTFTAGDNNPVWSPDGKHLAYDSAQTGIFWIRSDGSGSPQRLTKSGHIVFPYSFSPDGKRLAYTELSPETGFDIWMLPLEGNDPDHPKAGTPEPFLHTTANEQYPAFSPDGRWVAYSSDESGTIEVYVQPFPGPASKWRVSTAGGRMPIWSRSGRELAYQTLHDRIMMAPYSVNGASFTPGRPRSWSDKQLASLPAGQNMDLAPDGKRFAVLMAQQTEPRSPTEVTFLLNFFDELRRRVPTAGK
jgi:Tol biopolymer transport system component